MSKFKQICRILGWKDALCVLLVSISFVTCCTVLAARKEIYAGAEKLAATSAAYEAQIAELETQVGRQMNTIASLSAEPKKMQIEVEAEDLAKLIYGQARWNSEQAQAALCACVLNRVGSSLYPDSVAEVCRQSSQWMGWSEENPVIEAYYETAKAVLTDYYNGGRRILDTDMLWMDWTRDYIEFRTAFETSRSTRYMKVS